MSSLRGNVLRRLASQIRALEDHRESVQGAINNALGPAVALLSTPCTSAPPTRPPSPPPVSSPARTRSRPVSKKATRSMASQPQGSVARHPVVSAGCPMLSTVSRPRGSVAHDPSGLAVKSCPTAAPRQSRLSHSPALPVPLGLSVALGPAAMSSSPDPASEPSRRGFAPHAAYLPFPVFAPQARPLASGDDDNAAATLTSLDPSLAAPLATPRQVRESSRRRERKHSKRSMWRDI